MTLISIGRTLIQTVAGSDLANVVFDAAELALDGDLPSGLLKDVPFFGALANLARAHDSIRSHLFTKKVLQFLLELKSVPESERAILLEKYADGTTKQAELGENLLLALERLDNMQKPKVLAKFFSAYIRTEITFTTFSRLAQALERFNLELYPALEYLYHPGMVAIEVTEDIKHELSLAGLLTVHLSGSGAIAGGALYMLSPIGRHFLRIGFGMEETK